MAFNYANVLSTLAGRLREAAAPAAAAGTGSASTPPTSPPSASLRVPGEDYLPADGGGANNGSGTGRRLSASSSSRSVHYSPPYSPRAPSSHAPLPGRSSPGSYAAAAAAGTEGSGRSGRARPSSPVLLHPLPPSLVLEKESRAQSELELDRQAAQRRRERELAEALQDQTHNVERIRARDEVGTWTRSKTGKGKGKDDGDDENGGEGKSGAPFTRPPHAYELYQAIDKRDLDFIARVRDHAFELLLQKNAGEFPVIYASRWGDTHRDVVILLVGAFSRYVNHLDEEDFKKKEVQNTLKMLRANLKLAIDNALLPSQQSNLLSSYLQVLIMSEGDMWVLRSTADLGLLLRDEHSRPVAEAEGMVRKFSTRELRGVPGGVGDVEEYIANAALDLVIMAAWSVAAAQMGVEPLPTYTFARDLRTFIVFTEALNEHRAKLTKVTRRVRAIIRHLEDLAGNSRKGVRERLRDVRAAVDGGEAR